MEAKGKWAIGIVASVLVAGLALVFFVLPGGEPAPPAETPETPKTSHAPIAIDGETELANFANKTGSGTKTDPYVIENLNITSGTTERLIYLKDIYSYVAIRDCVLASTYTTHTYGIYLETCGNITIEGNKFTGFSSEGITALFLYRSSNNSIRGNVFESFTSTYQYGISCIQISGSGGEADNNTITGNTFTDFVATHHDYGIHCIYVNNGDNTTISGNIFANMQANRTDNSDGITVLELVGSESLTFRDNRACNLTCEKGVVWMAYSTSTGHFLQVVNNSATNVVAKRFYGIGYGVGSGGLIANNTLATVEVVESFIGIYLQSVGSTTIQGNIIRDFTWEEESFSVLFQTNAYNNEVMGNIFDVGDFPVQDRGGTNNRWYGYMFYEVTQHYQYVGNYYWNYTGVDADGDFIGDTPQSCWAETDPYPIVWGALDCDGDLLFNHEEKTQGTQPYEEDSDADGWSDYQEVHVYGTNPLNPDTDGDGMIDPIDPQPLVHSFGDVLSIGIIAMLAFVGIAILLSRRRGSRGMPPGRSPPKELQVKRAKTPARK